MSTGAAGRNSIASAAQVWRGGAAGEKPEDLVRQKARPRHHHMAAAMAVMVRKIETQRLQQVKMLARVIAT